MLEDTFFPWETLPAVEFSSQPTSTRNNGKTVLTYRAKQMVIAGLKWPPDVGAQVIMAKAIPIAKAQPI